MLFFRASRWPLPAHAGLVILLLSAGLAGIALTGTLRSCATVPDLATGCYTDTNAAWQPPERNSNQVWYFIHDILQNNKKAQLKPQVACLTVPLRRDVLYQLQYQTTYQVIATTDSTLLLINTSQLDQHDISYDVFKNTGTYVLLQTGEWIVCWGGILYLPGIKQNGLN